MANEFFTWVAELESSGYTVLMTIIYALLVILGLYILYRWIKYEQLPINTAFVLSSCLYIILGGLLHVVDDMTVNGANLIDYPWRLCFTTPLVYILVMVFGILVMDVSHTLEKKKLILTYVKPYAAVGVISCLAVFGILVWYGVSYAINGFDVAIIGIVVGIAVAATAALWAILRFVCRWKYVSNPLYIALMFCQYLDSSATGYAIDFEGYYEQHVLGSWLINLTGTGYSMFLLKTLVLVIGIWILERFKKEEGFHIPWHLIILVMMIVGLGPGIRDLFRMVLGI